MSINIVKMVNKNDDGYNYFDLNFIGKIEIGNKPNYSFNVMKYLYNVFYKARYNDYHESLNEHISGSYPGCDTINGNCNCLYPIDIKLNDFDLLLGRINTQLDFNYNNFIQNLLKILIEIDKDITIYNTGSLKFNKGYNNLHEIEEEFININNDISKIKFNYTNTFANKTYNIVFCSIIIKSKIIDMNLLYYLIYNDMNFIQIFKNRFYFTLKNNNHYDWFDKNIVVKNINPIYETNNYKLNPKNGYSSIINIDIYKYVENNISFNQNSNSNSNLKTNSNSDLIAILQQELNEQIKINEELQKENEELKLKLSKQSDIIQKLLN